MRLRKLIVLLLLLPGMACADAVQHLHRFFQDTQALRARFQQTVLDAQGRKVQQVDGVMQLLRPGRFRWDYHKPYVQIIVGDGQKVWLFDPELNQVTVRAMDQVLGSSPAAMLAGGRETEKAFILRDSGRQGVLEWVEVTPRDKSAESGFERILIGFNDARLEEMELHDHFGQTTVIVFSQMEHNPRLEARNFRFVPPVGADIAGE